MQPKDWLRDDTKNVLRDQFAGQVLAALLARGYRGVFGQDLGDPGELAELSYKYADAMLVAREKRDYIVKLDHGAADKFGQHPVPGVNRHFNWQQSDCSELPSE